MRIEDTAGNITYIIPNCDCGLTGGCEKCQPIHIPKYNGHTLAEKLNFYEQTKEQKLRAMRERSHERYGEAWQYLADH